MYIPLGIKTDYSLLKSLIKIEPLINYLKDQNINTCGILDENLFSSMCFYDTCKKNDLKPIIGLIINLENAKIYLYAKNYNGYQNLLKLNTLNQQNKYLATIDLKKLKDDIICVIPYEYNKFHDELSSIYQYTFISYKNEFEKNNALIVSKTIVFLNETCSIYQDELKYLKILKDISGDENFNLNEYQDSYLEKMVNDDDAKTTINFSELINLEIPKNIRHIPHYDDSIKDSYSYLSALCKKGLAKRLNNNVKEQYVKRLMHELKVIKDMNFVDYFLIVYDYVKYAKQNDILVGPGRGSAAGSLVSYSLGITNVDPLKYNLLFERFLNPERVTLPDIDIDFEYTKRDKVIEYVKNKYGFDKVSNIMTFGTLTSKQVIRDVAKCLKLDNKDVDKLCNLLDPKLSLSENFQKETVKNIVSSNKELQKVYNISYKLEGLKRHISTHAAGVVISSVPLDEVIPIFINNTEVLTGTTMEYLEELGLIKMDFLALRNLTIIKNVLELIKNDGENVNLNAIPLDDKKTYELFLNVDTEGIFQFESSGMKNFISKLKPNCFMDLVAALALFRPGPMQNIDSFIKRKQGKEKIDYIDSSLEEILKETYGIMIYQEQIMQVLVKIGNYSFAKADNIRRAMSKKKIAIMEKEREVFISSAVKNNYPEQKANEIYDLIIKFANYGFNKAHSVSYAFIGYQMAYLKAHYPVYFIANLLNMSIGSDIKTKEYIDEARLKNISVYKPNINVSTDQYLIKDKSMILPLNVIHNVGIQATNEILAEREKNGEFSDFLNFVSRVYGKSVNKKTIESLIDADAFRTFNINHQTLIKNLDLALDYAMLCQDLDESLIEKPLMTEQEEFSSQELIERELNTFGFYVSNHPASKFQKDIVKFKNIKEYFDKYINCVIIINSIKKIKTKNGEDMAFIQGSDETGKLDLTIFPKNIKYLIDLKENDLVKVRGQVIKRFDKYQIIVFSIEKI